MSLFSPYVSDHQSGRKSAALAPHPDTPRHILAHGHQECMSHIKLLSVSVSMRNNHTEHMQHVLLDQHHVLGLKQDSYQTIITIT